MEPELRANMADLRDSLNNILLAGHRGSGPRPASPANDLVKAMSQREVSGFSLTRMIKGIVDQDRSACGLEKNVSDALQTALKLTKRSPNSFFVPTHLPFQTPDAPRSRLLGSRALYQVGTAAQGGNLVETELMGASFVEVLRNATVTGQLGARYMEGLVGGVDIPRQNSTTQAYWVGESVALTESEATFDKVSLRPHVVGALSRFSRLMLQQSTPSIEQIARDDLISVGALAVDAAVLYGPGTGSQPTGIANTTGVGSVIGGTNGASLTFDLLTSMWTQTLTGNAPQANLGFAFNGKVKGFLATLKASTGQYLWNPSQSIAAASPDAILGYKYAVSNQLPYNLTKGTSTNSCSMIIFGNWQEVIIGEWGVAEIDVNPYDTVGFTEGDVIIRMFQTIDVGVRHPVSFSVMSDATTPGF